METEETAGATQAALLLLAGDSDSQPSQPPADSDSQPFQRPADSDSESVEPPVGADSESVQPHADTGDSETAGVTSAQVAPPADGSAMESADEDGNGSDEASRVSVTGCEKGWTAHSPRKVARMGGGGDRTITGSAVNASMWRLEESTPAPAPAPANTDVSGGCGVASVSLSKSAKLSSVVSDIGDRAEIVSRANNTRTSALAVGQSSVEEEMRLSSARRSERSFSGRGDAEAKVADDDAGSASGQAGSSSRPGRDRAEQSSTRSGPPTAASTIPSMDDGDATAVSELPSHSSTPRLIPSTPDSGSRCSSPALSASPDLYPTGNPAAGSRGAPSGPGRTRPAAVRPRPCFSAAQPGDLGAALLELLRTGTGPPTASLLCSDGPVAVHEAVLAARCPPLYRAVADAGGRLPLPEVSRRAAAALVRILYLGGTECAVNEAPLPQLLLLAERFGLTELVQYLREGHGVTEPARPLSPAPTPASVPVPSPGPGSGFSPGLGPSLGSGATTQSGTVRPDRVRWSGGDGAGLAGRGRCSGV